MFGSFKDKYLHFWRQIIFVFIYVWNQMILIRTAYFLQSICWYWFYPIYFEWKRKVVEWMVLCTPRSSRRRFSSFPASFYQIFSHITTNYHIFDIKDVQMFGKLGPWELGQYWQICLSGVVQGLLKNQPKWHNLHIPCVGTYLIFVTKFTCETCGEKSVMWRNFGYLYLANGGKSEKWSRISDFSTWKM